MIPDQPYITVLVYKYKRYAPWMLAAYCIMVLGFFAISAELNNAEVIIYCSILFCMPVYAALFPKSIFSIRSWDDKKLTITATSIEWNGTSMPVNSLKELSIYIFSYDNFRHREEDGKYVRTATEAGDQNKLEFVYGNEDFDFTFFLPDFEYYDALMGIIAAWENAGYNYSARAAFDREYILSEIQFYSTHL